MPEEGYGGTEQPRDDPPWHVANETASLQEQLVEHHQGARRAGVLDEPHEGVKKTIKIKKKERGEKKEPDSRVTTRRSTLPRPGPARRTGEWYGLRLEPPRNPTDIVR